VARATIEERLSTQSNPRDWDPWILWVALAELLVVGIAGLRGVGDVRSRRVVIWDSDRRRTNDGPRRALLPPPRA
jgi:hypothetical protein